jgi:HEAT repeat protein
MSHPLLAQLRSPEPAARAGACREALRDPSGALLAEALVEALADSEKAVARAAADSLVALARASSGVLPLLRKALRAGPRSARIHAAFALARLEPPEPALLPALVEALAAPDGDVRWSAARILVDMGRLHGEVLGVLLGLAAAAERPPVRRMASFALRTLAPDRPEAARVLLAATRDADGSVRRAAVTALAGLLDPPPEVAARLGELRADRDPALARLAELALGELERAEGRR